MKKKKTNARVRGWMDGWILYQSRQMALPVCLACCCCSDVCWLGWHCCLQTVVVRPRVEMAIQLASWLYCQRGCCCCSHRSHAVRCQNRCCWDCCRCRCCYRCCCRCCCCCCSCLRSTCSPLADLQKRCLLQTSFPQGQTVMVQRLGPYPKDREREQERARAHVCVRERARVRERENSEVHP